MGEKKNVTGIQTYQKTDILTANRETILLMLYAGAIRFLKQAIEHGKNGNKAKKCENLTRVQRIVSELRAALNFQAGGEIARNLEALYAFITRRLIEAVMDTETRGMEEALQLMVDLNSAWEQAIAQLRKAETKTPK